MSIIGMILNKEREAACSSSGIPPSPPSDGGEGRGEEVCGAKAGGSKQPLFRLVPHGEREPDKNWASCANKEPCGGRPATRHTKAGKGLDTRALRFKNPRVAAIKIENLTKTFPATGGGGGAVTAVAGVSVEIFAGELLALVGPSGCGKTTLLRLMAGLEETTSGHIAIAGQDQRGVPPERRDVAMVFQTLALYPHMTARGNLEFGLKLRKTPTAEIEARVGETAKLLGIADCLARRPAELSSGQRQRVALGRALVRRPKVLLLDEPFANLDAPLRREMRRELQRLHCELKLTTILVTHDQAEALALGQRVAVMNAGRLEQVATPGELRARPANEFVAAFFDQRPL